MLYHSLAAKDRRRYAALAARTLGRGGLRSIARLLSGDRHTLAQGMPELPDPEAMTHTRIRRAGGGRTPRHALLPALDTALLPVLQEHTAGAPMHAAVQWTTLTHQESADRWAAEHGMEVRVTVVTRRVRQHDVVRRTAPQRTRTGAGAHREAQCGQSARLTEDSLACGQPVVSLDTKKKR